ncbi:uncharacterized protein [Blastocystis hominis]|uniref:Uncharacterized protein n=1 Tax=Blastocystis hominis TaxID=12968 RepID=D8M551_BLAHO|nr:uncharacterized protein [Blastocystis hominis]CBK23202.2 unnamed protein product [Blastocystis hominis]|eukprot:XP_012897250.1 uncharacterized protein [Blastocystis hominis]
MNSVQSGYTLIDEEALDNVESTMKTVDALHEKLSQKVMIPVGPLAFMEGSLIHTNEFMCSLGKDYFVWKSAKGTTELLQRRKEYIEGKMKGVDDQLKKLEDYRSQLRYLEVLNLPFVVFP